MRQKSVAQDSKHHRLFQSLFSRCARIFPRTNTQDVSYDPYECAQDSTTAPAYMSESQTHITPLKSIHVQTDVTSTHFFTSPSPHQDTVANQYAAPYGPGGTGHQQYAHAYS